MAKSFWKGISRFELIVIFAVLTALTLVTVPTFQRFRCRAMQSEAKYVLGNIYMAEKFYFSEKGQYADLDYLVQSGRLGNLPIKRYNFRMDTPPSSKEFVVNAIGKPQTDIAGDIWTIDESHELRHLTHACQ